MAGGDPEGQGADRGICGNHHCGLGQSFIAIPPAKALNSLQSVSRPHVTVAFATALSVAINAPIPRQQAEALRSSLGLPGLQLLRD